MISTRGLNKTTMARWSSQRTVGNGLNLGRLPHGLIRFEASLGVDQVGSKDGVDQGRLSEPSLACRHERERKGSARRDPTGDLVAVQVEAIIAVGVERSSNDTVCDCIGPSSCPGATSSASFSASQGSQRCVPASSFSHEAVASRFPTRYQRRALHRRRPPIVARRVEGKGCRRETREIVVASAHVPTAITLNWKPRWRG